MKTKLFRKIVETHGRASLLLATAYCLVRAGFKPAPYCLLLLLLATAPAFADAPQDTDLLYVCAGKGYKLTSVRKAEGSALTYTWHRDSGDGKGFQAIQDSNADSYTVSATANNTAGTYAYVRTVKGENCPNELPSNTYTIVVLKPEAPVINVLLSSGSGSVCEGNAVVFGIQPVDNTTYTWTTVQGDTDTNNGSSNSSYTIGSSATYGMKQVQASASVTYDIGNSETKVCVSTLSDVAAAVVQPLPVITDNTTADACGSGKKDLTVEITVANAEPKDETAVSIQWYSDKNGGDSAIQDATSASYTTDPLTKTKAYYVGATVNATQCKSDGLTEVTATIHVDEGKINASEEEDGEEG